MKEDFDKKNNYLGMHTIIRKFFGQKKNRNGE
jgi:hypothetical protein